MNEGVWGKKEEGRMEMIEKILYVIVMCVCVQRQVKPRGRSQENYLLIIPSRVGNIHTDKSDQRSFPSSQAFTLHLLLILLSFFVYPTFD